MKRFFCPKNNIGVNEINIVDKKEIHHIVSVLRCKNGDKVNIFDGDDREYYGKISLIQKDRVVIAIASKRESSAKKVTLTIACSIPKKSKFDFLLEKCTELGVDRIIPMLTDRTVVVLDDKHKASKVERWRKIVLSACKQCGRNSLPEVDKVKSFKDVIGEAGNYDLVLFLCLEDERREIKDVLSKFEGKSIIVFIGPEGDFTEREISLAKQSGCNLVSLGDKVLRVETAAIFISSIHKFIFD